MRSFRQRPVGWRNDNYRHYLAAKYGSATIRMEGKYHYDDNESKTKWSLNQNLKGVGKVDNVIKYGDRFVATADVDPSLSESDVKSMVEKGGFQYVTVDKKDKPIKGD